MLGAADLHGGRTEERRGSARDEFGEMSPDLDVTPTKRCLPADRKLVHGTDEGDRGQQSAS